MNLTPENYYSNEADWHYMSVSQYKGFIFCEEAALAKLKGKYVESKQDCFLFGTYVHAAIEGPEAMEKFKAETPEMFSTRGESKGQLKAEYKRADLMIETLRNDTLCSMMLEGNKEVIVTAELFGVKWKSKIDVLAPEDGRITDLKTVKAIRERYWKDGQWVSFVENFGYVTQMAVYSELERIASRRFERLEPFIVAVSKEEVPDKEIICFDEDALLHELEKVREYLPRVIAVKSGLEKPKRCGGCKYCKQTKKSSIVHYMSLLEG